MSVIESAAIFAAFNTIYIQPENRETKGSFKIFKTDIEAVNYIRETFTKFTKPPETPFQSLVFPITAEKVDEEVYLIGQDEPTNGHETTTIIPHSYLEEEHQSIPPIKLKFHRDAGQQPVLTLVTNAISRPDSEQIQLQGHVMNLAQKTATPLAESNSRLLTTTIGMPNEEIQPVIFLHTQSNSPLMAIRMLSENQAEIIMTPRLFIGKQFEAQTIDGN